MSGIAGILNLDGAPVDRALMERLTRFLDFRGPDASSVWIGGPVGFGHTLLRTTWESEKESQPCSLDGDVWITADARIDAREDLIRKLGADETLRFAPDVELILRAYERWGEGCLDHLIGDFAFAIWDGRKRRLFCARDHFGVKPFFYAQAGNCVVFSNTLNCVREHPLVSDQLNDSAIADFLLFGFLQDSSASTYKDVRRLMPAHYAVWSASGSRVERYWTLPVEDVIYYRRADDYVEHFKDLLDKAVADRVRTDHVSICMSGGLDSPLLAACARKMLPEGGLHAYSVVYEGLIPDQERYYSGLVAEFLNIPIHYTVGDRCLSSERWFEFASGFPEPEQSFPCAPLSSDELCHMSKHARVAFYGDGPDNLLQYDWRPYLSDLYQRGQFARFAAATVSSLWFQPRFPLALGLVGRFRSKQGSAGREPGYPGWLNSEFARRLDLPERWNTVRRPTPRVLHPAHPVAYHCMTAPLWPAIFESCDAAAFRVPMEVRQPYLDLRVARYLLTVPPVPWCRAKLLMRRALTGLVPEAVGRRPKTPLAGDPVFEFARRYGIPRPTLCPQICGYVNVTSVPVNVANNAEEFWMNLRPVALSYWLNSVDRNYTQKEQETYAIRR